jgi:hypothetical protein
MMKLTAIPGSDITRNQVTGLSSLVWWLLIAIWLRSSKSNFTVGIPKRNSNKSGKVAIGRGVCPLPVEITTQFRSGHQPDSMDHFLKV